jgi:1-acyl-sn-glycerol-3-phosphate acyltransferase
MKKFSENLFYRFYKCLFGLGLRVYYKKITVNGMNAVPLDGPIITTSNHPTGLMDVFLAGVLMKRQIKFTAAGSLFKDKLQAGFLTSVGTIPVYRRKDTPDEMDKNVEAFEYCFRELEDGGAVGFYPEGTSHPEPWVNPIKTGAARVALQAEARNDFHLDLKIVPIGINSTHPGAYRGSVLVNFGDPISLDKYHQTYKQDSSAAVEQLTSEIKQIMETCAFHIKDKLLLDLIDCLKTIGYDEVILQHHNTKVRPAKFYYVTKVLAERLSQSIAGSDSEKEAHEKLNSLSQKAHGLKNQIYRLRINAYPVSRITTFLTCLSLLFVSLLALPIALPVTAVNIPPFLLAKKLGRKLAGQDMSLIPAARLMMGAVFFILYYLFLFTVIGIFIGIFKAIAISLLLLIGGYFVQWYWEGIKALMDGLRKMVLWLTNREMMESLLKSRDEFIRELNGMLELKTNSPC